MENLFRKKSLESLNSPDNLDEYLKVTNVPGWLILIACMLVLAGLIIWSFNVQIDGISAFVDIFK
ncbi:MAG: hypothetical protein PHD11_09465 [Bacteroidales bacterium]|nr:hypothetical protein [Bacteroidales bacterium]MDD4671280.1 hypothetical protein [Bacteroidales bacterium]